MVSREAAEKEGAPFFIVSVKHKMITDSARHTIEIINSSVDFEIFDIFISRYFVSNVVNYT